MSYYKLVNEGVRKSLGGLHSAKIWVLKPSGRLIAPTYCHGENGKSRLVSRIMGLFGFKAYSRFSIRSYSDALTANGFHITDSHVFAGTPPLACLTAQKRSL